MSEGTVVHGFKNEHGRIGTALLKLQALLVQGESLRTYAVQRRLFALTHRRMIVAATTGRLIIMHRGLIGGFKPSDVRWQDVKDANLKVGIFGAELKVSVLDSTDLAISGRQTITYVLGGLRKAEAERVYTACQAEEQAWREKRRIRDLEEMRAKSGGIHLGSPSAITGAVAGPVNRSIDEEDPVSRLRRAKEMHNTGLISDSEFEAAKAKIVATL